MLSPHKYKFDIFMAFIKGRKSVNRCSLQVVVSLAKVSNQSKFTFESFKIINIIKVSKISFYRFQKVLKKVAYKIKILVQPQIQSDWHPCLDLGLNRIGILSSTFDSSDRNISSDFRLHWNETIWFGYKFRNKMD